MLISVIIPNYNHAAFLRKRIDSVLQQTYQDIEVILLDDCSTDNSREVLDEYKSHCKVSNILYNDVNSGSTFKQWKKGIDIAKGNWIWIAESDDWCEPSLLAELISPVYANPEVTLSFCQSVLINPQNEVMYTTTAPKLFSVFDGDEFVAKYLLGYNRIINASMVIFKKECFNKIPLDYMNMIFCGDWFIWANVCMQGRVFVSGKFLNYYLRHDSNVANAAVKRGFEFLEGNNIFSYISGKIHISPEDKNAALRIIVNTYFRTREMFMNEDVHAKVLKAIMLLDPSVKGIIDSVNEQNNKKSSPASSKKALLFPVKLATYSIVKMQLLVNKIIRAGKKK